MAMALGAAWHAKVHMWCDLAARRSPFPHDASAMEPT
jgi:hypothetical protein